MWAGYEEGQLEGLQPSRMVIAFVDFRIIWNGAACL